MIIGKGGNVPTAARQDLPHVRPPRFRHIQAFPTHEPGAPGKVGILPVSEKIFIEILTEAAYVFQAPAPGQ